MKLSCLLLPVLVLAFSGSASVISASSSSSSVATAGITTTGTSSFLPNKWTPTRIAFDQLHQSLSTDDDNHDNHDDAATSTTKMLWKALKETGIVSITDIPNFPKSSLLHHLEDCLMDEESTDDSNKSFNTFSKSTTFEDGTKRQTIATRSISGRTENLFTETTTTTAHAHHHHDSSSSSSSCYDLLQSSFSFRSQVQQVINGIATLIGQHSSSSHTTPLLQDAHDDTKTYDLEETLKDGEHLEHFHAYHYPETKTTTTTVQEEDLSINTIDWHTDQGIMIAFTPGERNQHTTDGFFVKLLDGEVVEVDLDGHIDDLVIMLGEGVYQYINQYLSSEDQLHSVQHALKLTTNNNNQDDDDHNEQHPRVWYGRMVLPPPTAYHPSSYNNNGKIMTVQEMRMAMIEHDPEALLLGCSSTSSSSSSEHQHQQMIARELADDIICNTETSQICWHRCMNYTDYPDATPTVCANQNLSTACVNDDGFLWTDKHDPDFHLGCIDLATAENVTYPSDDGEGDGDGDGVDGNDSTHGSDDHHDDDKNADCSTVNVTDLASCAAWCGDNYTATFEPMGDHGHDNSGIHLNMLIGFSCECEEEGPTSTTRAGDDSDKKSCLLPYDLPSCAEEGLAKCGEEGDGATKTCSELCASLGIGLIDDDSDDMCMHMDVEGEEHDDHHRRSLAEGGHEDGDHHDEEEKSYTMCFCDANAPCDGMMVCADYSWNDGHGGDSHDVMDESSSPPMMLQASPSYMMLAFLVATITSFYF